MAEGFGEARVTKLQFSLKLVYYIFVNFTIDSQNFGYFIFQNLSKKFEEKFLLDLVCIVKVLAQLVMVLYLKKYQVSRLVDDCLESLNKILNFPFNLNYYSYSSILNADNDLNYSILYPQFYKTLVSDNQFLKLLVNMFMDFNLSSFLENYYFNPQTGSYLSFLEFWYGIPEQQGQLVLLNQKQKYLLV